MMTIRTTRRWAAAGFSIAAIAVVALPVSAGQYKDTVWTAPIDSVTTKCTVTNASDEDLRVVIRILDAHGRSENPDAPVPRIYRLTTGEIVLDPYGYPLTRLEVVLPPGGSDGIYRSSPRLPATSLTPPTSCQVQAERTGVVRVSYCELLTNETETETETINCMQAP